MPFPLPGTPSPSCPSIRITQPSFSIFISPLLTFHTQGSVATPVNVVVFRDVEIEKLFMSLPFSSLSLDILPEHGPGLLFPLSSFPSSMNLFRGSAIPYSVFAKLGKSMSGGSHSLAWSVAWSLYSCPHFLLPLGTLVQCAHRIHSYLICIVHLFIFIQTFAYSCIQQPLQQHKWNTHSRGRAMQKSYHLPMHPRGWHSSLCLASVSMNEWLNEYE